MFIYPEYIQTYTNTNHLNGPVQWVRVLHGTSLVNFLRLHLCLRLSLFHPVSLCWWKGWAGQALEPHSEQPHNESYCQTGTGLGWVGHNIWISLAWKEHWKNMVRKHKKTPCESTAALPCLFGAASRYSHLHVHSEALSGRDWANMTPKTR